MKKVLVDSSVWSLYFRKEKNLSEADMRIIAKVNELNSDNRIVIIGAVRQEVLSGISSKEKFEKIEERLSFLEDFPVTTKNHITAARFFNECRSHGIQGAHNDFLIAAVAAENGFEVFTLDGDFSEYRNYIGVTLFGLDE